MNVRGINFINRTYFSQRDLQQYDNNEYFLKEYYLMMKHGSLIMGN